MALVSACYRLTADYPDDERFGLVSQIRRAAVSIPANIVEGVARQTAKVFVHSLYIARGSLVELETHLEISERLSLLKLSDEDRDSFDRLFAELNNFILRLKQRSEART